MSKNNLLSLPLIEMRSYFYDYKERNKKPSLPKNPQLRKNLTYRTSEYIQSLSWVGLESKEERIMDEIKRKKTPLRMNCE